ncbi:hypothetical protein H6G17_31965 [Chroococcidiopsis sp. FACHB-1243]|uniref:hypothetical protein n=1 Tax=Chroococcidiopsis sp. [FACHB-1243] TaxID=2692781 RepID=UPI00177C7D34|nr:hypothetical protein [Chroococcidiopsis sp. [FACHB-1243]]MBD2310014.1 hypothetical protein [Chroococcidiopsis sp. [FACHB-1243]]
MKSAVTLPEHPKVIQPKPTTLKYAVRFASARVSVENRIGKTKDILKLERITFALAP